ncbi:MAG: rod-binding protein [Thermodesulfobacteriota bacterium]
MIEAAAAETLDRKTSAAAAEDMKARLERLGRLKKACADLESLFLTTLIQAMRQTVPDAGLLPEAVGADVYQSIADQRLAEYLGQAGGLGLGRTIFEQVARREETADLDRKLPALDELRYSTTVARALLGRTGSPALPDGLLGP